MTILSMFWILFPETKKKLGLTATGTAPSEPVGSTAESTSQPAESEPQLRQRNVPKS
jgi:hypothetical protein